MISRKRILGFAIGKMLRQDGWAEKYNSKNQFNVNQYDYSTCKELVLCQEKGIISELGDINIFDDIRTI